MSLLRLSLARGRRILHSAWKSFVSHNIFTPGSASIVSSSPLVENSHPPTVDPEQLSRLKHPSRAGQDLSYRYQRLERSLRGKASYARENQQSYTANEESQEARDTTGRPSGRIFKGFVVPEAPKPPAEDECCMSGCAICVYDLYDEAREDYVRVMDNLRSELKRLGIAESEWPADVRHDWQGRQTGPISRSDVTLSAFGQLEQALRAKREQAASGSAPESTVPSVILKRPRKKVLGLNDIYEGLRWVVSSNR